MNTLYVSFNYPPETGAGSARTRYNVQALRELGHDVTVLVPVPNYPTGVVYDGWRRRISRRDRQAGVLWVWIKPSLAPTPASRILPYATYNVSGFIGACLIGARNRFDAVVATSPPLPAIAFVAPFSSMTRAKLALDLRDIWPDAGLNMGTLKPGAPETRVTAAVERLLLRRSSINIVTSPGDVDNLRRKGVASDRIAFVPNGADTDLFSPAKRLPVAERARRYGGGRGFAAIYSGSFNFGMNDVELLTNLAHRVGNQRPGFTLFYVGSGRALEQIRDTARATANPERIVFLPPISHAQLAPLIASVDAGLVPLKNVPDTGGNIPVKMFEYWAASLPIAIGLHDTSNTLSIFERCHAGIRFTAGDGADALRALDEIAAMPVERRRALGVAGRTLVDTEYSRRALARRFAELVLHRLAE